MGEDETAYVGDVHDDVSEDVEIDEDVEEREGECEGRGEWRKGKARRAGGRKELDAVGGAEGMSTRSRHGRRREKGESWNAGVVYTKFFPTPGAKLSRCSTCARLAGLRATAEIEAPRLNRPAQTTGWALQSNLDTVLLLACDSG